MNKFLLSFITLVIFLGTAVSQSNITNGSFENWTGIQPDGWSCPYNSADFQNVFQSDDAYEGSYSAELQVLYNDTYMFAPPAQMFSANIGVTQQHESLNGYFKGMAEGSDSLQVVVTMLENNTAVGVGVFSTSASASAWTAFSAPIVYFSKSVPDEATIAIIAGSLDSSIEGTIYKVDNLSFGESAGIEDMQVPGKVSLYPSPATESVAVTFTLGESDELDFELITPEGETVMVVESIVGRPGENSHQIDVTKINSGLYILSVHGEKYHFAEKILISR